MTSVVHTWELGALLQNIVNLSKCSTEHTTGIVCTWDLIALLQNIVNLNECSTIIMIPDQCRWYLGSQRTLAEHRQPQ